MFTLRGITKYFSWMIFDWNEIFGSNEVQNTNFEKNFNILTPSIYIYIFLTAMFFFLSDKVRVSEDLQITKNKK